MAIRLFRKKPDFAKRIGVRAPSPAPDRCGLAIILIVKNEELDVEEWARFHRAVGVSHFFVYDNGCTDDTVKTLRRTLSPSELTVIPWTNTFVDEKLGRTIDNQVLSYAHAVSNFGGHFRWMAAIDVDEFIVPKKSPSILEALENVNGFPNVSLPWHVFGRNGFRTRPQGGVLRNYLTRAADPMDRKLCNFKCIFDPCEVIRVTTHHVRTRGYGDDTCNDVGDVVTLKARRTRAFYSSENLQLNHYFCRSTEDLERKIARGAVIPISHEEHARHVREVVGKAEAATVEDRAALDLLDGIKTHPSFTRVSMDHAKEADSHGSTAQAGEGMAAAAVLGAVPYST